MIQRLDCSKCGVNQADTNKPFVALPMLFICQECYGRQVSTEEKIKELEKENHKLKLTMQLHAGDCCSLNTEVELFRGHWEDADDRCDKLEEALKLTMDRWRLIGRKVWDTKLQVSILELARQLEKDVEQILKG